MGNALYSNWDEAKEVMYLTKVIAINSTLEALAMVGTQYVVSQWIWCDVICKGGDERNHRRAPVYLLSTVMFFALWCLRFNFEFLKRIMGLNENNYPGFQIAYPTTIVGGIFLNILFSWSWTKFFPLEDDARRKTDVTGVDIDASLSSSNDGNSTQKNSTGSSRDLEDGATTETTNEVKFDSEPNTSSKIVEQNDLPKKEKPRVEYMNNVKIFLTNLVIIHHAAWIDLPGMARLKLFGLNNWWFALSTAFLSINQTYFMALFFFFSGYFVPKSFDKKGKYFFLFERFKRIGIPWALSMLVINPYILGGLSYGMDSTTVDNPNPTFVPDFLNVGVVWFLLILLLFSTIYAIVCGNEWSPTIKCPSLLGFAAIALVLGVVSGCLVLLTPGYYAVIRFYPSLFSVPAVAVRMLPIYSTMYWGGAVAQRNGWMETIKENSSIAIKAVLYSGLLFVPLMVVYCFNIEMFFRAVQQAMENPETPHSWYLVWGYNFFECFITPWLAVYLSLATTLVFLLYVNKRFFCTRFFSKAMYTAYIIHLPIIKLSQWIWVLLITKVNGAVVVDGVVTNPNLYFPAFLFNSVLGLLITWPLAYSICSIPGFSQVL